MFAAITTARTNQRSGWATAAIDCLAVSSGLGAGGAVRVSGMGEGSFKVDEQRSLRTPYVTNGVRVK